MSTAAYPAWTVRLCRGTPGAQDAADLVRAQGATVIWCSPGCCGTDEQGDPGD